MLKTPALFWTGVRAITALPAWRAQQALVILSEAVISFLALFLMKNGVAEMQILLIFAAIYLGGGLMIRLHRSQILPGGRLVPAALAALAVGGSLCGFISPRPESLALAALGVMALKDIATSAAVGDIHNAAERIGIPPTRLVSTGMLVGALLMIAALWGGGHILAVSSTIWAGLICGLASLIFFMILSKRINIKTAKRARFIPRDVRLTCHLSMIYNATSFVGKRFVLPLAVAHAAKSLGLGEDAYAALGMILSLLVLLGLATRGLSGSAANPRVMMYGGFFSGLTLWILLAVLLMRDQMTWAAAALAVLFLLAIELTAKIWTLGFIETLRLAARTRNQEDRQDTELSYFGYFMEVKCYGAGAGFLTAMGAMYLQMSVLTPASLAGICLGIWVASQTRTDRQNENMEPGTPVAGTPN